MSNHLSHNILNNKRSRSRSNSSGKEKSGHWRRTKALTTEKEKEMLQLLIQQDGNKKTHCEFCKKDISKTMKIVCADCQNLVYCVQCLVTEECGEVEKHQKHDFHIVDKLGFPVFAEEWNASEELLLLNGNFLFFIFIHFLFFWLFDVFLQFQD